MEERPPYDIRSGKVGKKREAWLDKWSEERGLPIEWLNKNGDIKDVDFFYFHEPEAGGIELESKDKQYEKFWLRDNGMDFLFSKVEKYQDNGYPIWYTLIISDYSECYSVLMDDFDDLGYLIKKPTRRKPKGEWFYRVPLEDCVITKL